MDEIESLQKIEEIKVLADPRRLAVLRILMARAATLTQLALDLNQSPAWIRHHIKALEAAGLVELTEIRTSQKVTEKYYRAKASAFLIQKLILPTTKKITIIFSGSHDLAIEEIARHISKNILLLSLPVGSLDGLANLRLGLCQISGAHLLEEGGEYNKEHVQNIFSDRSMELVTLAHRSQGLMVAPGNPKGIKGLQDLARPSVRFINRNRGSGTRLWFDSQLRTIGVSPTSINGYDHSVKTHTEAALLIKMGRAEAALGLQAAARAHWLDFIPLFEERYDLVLPREQEKILAPILEYIQGGKFRHSLDLLTGYSTAHSGELITIS